MRKPCGRRGLGLAVRRLFCFGLRAFLAIIPIEGAGHRNVAEAGEPEGSPGKYTKIDVLIVKETEND